MDFNLLSNAMRNNVLTTFVSVFIIALLSGCDKKFSPALRETDRLLSSDSKRGEVMLDSICKVDRNMSIADKKYCQLLRLKAADKAYRPIEKWKSRVDTLVSYFEHAGNENLLAEAYFYAGRVYYEIGDKPESLKFYQKACENVAKDNYALQGDIYCQMANVYSYKDLYDETLYSLQMAWKADSLSGNKHNMLFDLRDMGEACRSLKSFSASREILFKGLNLAEKEHDTLMVKYFHHALAMTFVVTEEWEKALCHTNEYIDCIGKFPDVSGALETALIVYTHFDDAMKVEKCRNLMLKSGNIFARRTALMNLLSSKIEATKDSDFKSIYDSCALYTDSIIEEDKAESVKKVEKIYNYDQKEIENQNLQFENSIKSLVIGLVFVMFLLFFLFYHMRIRTMRQKEVILRLKLDKYESLQEKIRIKPIEATEKERAAIKSSDIYKIVLAEKENNTYRLTDGQWKLLKKIINEVYVGFDKNLQTFLEVSLQEYRICMLVKIEVAPTDIAKFLNVTKEAITASRRRMYQKAFKKKGSPADWDNIVQSL